MTYLTVSITGDNIAQMRERIDIAKAVGAEAVELRTDYLADLSAGNIEKLFNSAKAAGLPVIATCRDCGQGGVKELPESLRADVLAKAVQCGVDYVDCEYDNFVKPVFKDKLCGALGQNPKARLILSVHNFSGSWAQNELSDIYAAIRSACDNCIPKLVYTAGHINDCFAAFDLLNEKDGEAVVLCMGAAGMLSRLIARKLGGLFSYFSLSDEQRTASGQITVEEAKTIYHWSRIGEKTEIFGVIGNPVAHSISPAVFNACFEACGVDAVHVPLLVGGGSEDFAAFMRNVLSRPWLGFGGFSVTIPHKTNALDFANSSGDFVEPLAESIGAVNTVKIGFGGIVSGYNTDCEGAVGALVAGMKCSRHDLRGAKIAVLGAGGAARAVIAGLTSAGARVTIYNRTVAKAKALAEEFGCKYLPLENIDKIDASVIVNCTSLGMYPNVEGSPLLGSVMSDKMTVFDTVYNPLRTQFLKFAEQAGAKTITGDEMFIRQAMAQYKIFIGAEPDEQVMRKAVLDCLS